ncbi:MAG TPA: cell division protein FtsA [Nitrospirales bacterium]|nr:cell division protein FtsA [Nitrospirales bacterium]HIO21981.1 cell division protein FtsA [Nitrospirales bacterium]
MRTGAGKKGRIIVGLDVGTTKICCIVSALTDEGAIDVIGLAVSPSRGLRKGVVVNIESTVESIKKAVEEAELMAGVQVNSVYVGIAGSHITGFNSRGYITIRNEDEGVTQADKTRAHEKAKPSRETFPKDREEIHTLPQTYTVDDQDGIKDPLGICGERLEVDIYIITGAKMTVQNVKRSVQRAGLDVAGVILQPLASSKAVLTSEETELGVAMVDLGGGTADLAIYSQGSLVHTAVLPIGGNHFTQDVAVGFRISQAEAEKIKVAYGSAMSAAVGEDEMFEALGIGGRPPRSVSRKALAEILEPRAEEMFELVGREIRQAGHESTVVAGLVLSGGTALLPGIVDVAERVLDLPVRVGSPCNLNGLRRIVKSPIYATAVGLILEAWRPSEGEKSGLEGTWQQPRNFFHRIKEWFF